MNRRDAETQSSLRTVLSNLCVSASLRLILALILAASACSIPNLEPPECTESRNAVREFYSFHFGNDMHFSNENLGLRKRFLTPQFFDRLNGTAQTVDPFTNTADLPKAFRVGECRVVEPGKHTDFDVLLFWKDNTRSEQRSVHAEAVKADDKWLIDNVKP